MKQKVDVLWKNIGNFFVNECIWVVSWRSQYNCICVCWKNTKVTYSQLVLWLKKSCWCISNVRKHWLSKSRFYSIYHNMKRRCNDVKFISYDRYWLKWIKCLWTSFEEFKIDMYDWYIEHCKSYWEKCTTLDRINSNGNYCKENCRRATYFDQANNNKNTKHITIDWVTKNQSERLRYYNISAWAFRSRINWWRDYIIAITTPSWKPWQIHNAN